MDTSALHAAKLAVRKAVFEATGEYFPVLHVMETLAAGILKQRNIGKILEGAVLHEEEWIYNHGAPLFVQTAEANVIRKKIQARIARTGRPPRAFLIPRAGMLICASPRDVLEVTHIAADGLLTRLGAAKFGGATGLTKKQRDALTDSAPGFDSCC